MGGGAGEGGATSANGGNAGGEGGAGAEGGVSSGGSDGGTGGVGGLGGAGGAGGASSVLTDRGLVARYFIDEADSGQMPSALADAAPNPVDLPLTYDPVMSYVGGGSGRGIEWSIGFHDGFASESIDGTKFRNDLEGTTQVTLEVVFDAEGSAGNADLVFQFQREGDPNADLGISVRDAQYPSIEFNDDVAGADVAAVFDVNVVSIGRTVVHVVIDTTEATTEDRIRLWVDGVEAAPFTVFPIAILPPDLNETLVFHPTTELNLGNRPTGDRPFRGQIFYAAVYSAAFTPQEIQDNLAILTLNDDSP